MTFDANQLALQHCIGFVGLVTSMLLAIAPLKAVLQANKLNSLGGLDTRPWPIFFAANMVWCLYSVRIGDVWLFFSTSIPALLWLFFNIVAIRLLSLEEGETEDPTHITPWEAGLLSHGTVELGEMCEAFRHKCILRIQAGIIFGVGIALLGAYCLGTWDIPGVENVDTADITNIKKTVFMALAGCSSLICYGQPVTRLQSLIKRRDASTVFIPLVLAQMFSNVVWASYGVVQLNPALMVPNGIGLILCCILIVLKVIFRGNSDSKSFQEGPSGSTDSLQLDADEENQLATTPRKQTAESDASTKEDSSHLEEAHFSDAIANTHHIKQAGGKHHCPKKSMHHAVANLPDLTHRLKEQGVYEDYLKWQADYRKWRQGSHQGARGEVHQVKVESQALESIPEGILPATMLDMENQPIISVVPTDTFSL